ncbi:uncharacterized protein LTR77_009204 [Saxophila tyrrhenica]|uniref:DUF7907 domain-containing protein n=1 Tax=Saxophila tyrrhenica TaxID=1690608 RepID=A0AAV9P181_9PEZI|nr:hypothetical protein LTR77_009204 [Saxophila tyrrhenica]
MKLPTLAAAALTLLTTAEAVKNTTQEFRLKTHVKPGQKGKAAYSDLYLEAYHTGAGLDDAVLVPKKKSGIKGFLNGTNGREGDIKYQNVVFDLGTDFGWSLIMAGNVEFYSGWQPVQVNAGEGPSDPEGDSGFWFNGTGLQWTSNPEARPKSPTNEFGGWLVCDWWHGVPQLFFRLSYYDDYPAPKSCADVYLCPEYI